MPAPPCHMFAECMCRGDTDPDWEYLLWGSCFSFRVIDTDCENNYFCNNYKSITQFPIAGCMSAQLELEIKQGLLTVVQEQCIFTYALGSLPVSPGLCGRETDHRHICGCDPGSVGGLILDQLLFSCLFFFVFFFGGGVKIPSLILVHHWI